MLVFLENLTLYVAGKHTLNRWEHILDIAGGDIRSLAEAEAWLVKPQCASLINDYLAWMSVVCQRFDSVPDRN